MALLPVRMTRRCPHLMSQSRYSLAFPDGNKGAETGGEHGGLGFGSRPGPSLLPCTPPGPGPLAGLAERSSLRPS